MNYVIRCYCLFDITHTGVLNRGRPPIDMNEVDWVYKRNTQCNYDTLMQAISIRSQPEIVAHPVMRSVPPHKNPYFGTAYSKIKKNIPCWTFDFSVQHASVFNDGTSELGALHSDCDNIPMILCGTESKLLTNFLYAFGENKNIHFETLS